MGPREGEWLDLYDRTGGKLSYREMLSAPILLLDVFRALDELAAQRSAYERATAAGSPR